MAQHKGAKAAKQSRVAGPFIALPHCVLESKAYRGLSHAARSLLIDVAKQYKSRNNGSLVACDKYLRPLGWTSKQTVQRSLEALVNAKLLHLTRQGGINRANWYALTWHDLDEMNEQDEQNESAKSFQRSAFDDRFVLPTIKGLNFDPAQRLPR